MKLLIVGASGVVGRHLLRDLQLHFGDGAEVNGTFHTNTIPHGISLDITDAESVARCVQQYNADTIVWLAGSKNVGLLEKDPTVGTELNEKPVASLVASLKDQRSAPKIIYLSSDYVFGGGTGQYHDVDPVGPSTVYGHSKVTAEKILLQSQLDVVCLRTSAIMSLQGGFLTWLLTELRAGRDVPLFRNTMFSPTPAAFLTAAVTRICDLPYGQRVLNFAGPRMSRFEFGRAICTAYGFPSALIQSAEVDLGASTLQSDLSLSTSTILADLAPASIADFASENCK